MALAAIQAALLHARFGAAPAEAEQVTPFEQVIARGGLGGHVDGVVQRQQANGHAQLDLLREAGGFGNQQVRHRQGIGPVEADVLGDPGLLEARLVGHQHLVQVLSVRIRRGLAMADAVGEQPYFHPTSL